MSDAPPLSGVRVVEFASIGPGPHCGMLLADLGAEVLRIDRDGGNGWANPVVDRGRATLSLDIRTPAGRDRALDMLDRADVLLEGMRPGVMERLGLGPDVVLKRNPRLIYGRMTGWGQDGPLASVAGHDINYIAVSGALAAMGTPGEPPPPPLNLVGDFGGGSMFLAFGILAALFERERSGKGQVVDAAIIDGVTSMMTMFSGLAPAGRLSLDRRDNLLGGAAPFYRCYACADGHYIAVGALEPKFFAALLEALDLPADLARDQQDVDKWPALAERFAAIFATRSRDDWAADLAQQDVCVAPVLSLAEAQHHPHMVARRAYAEIEGRQHAAPAPRFSRSRTRPAYLPADESMLRRWGVAEHHG